MNSDDRERVLRRFWLKVNKNGPIHSTLGTECWMWTAFAQGRGGGYGKFYDGESRVRAHRFAYEALVGPIPAGLSLDHLCRNTRCVRPDHLEPVTLAENARRGDAGRNMAIKTHCPKGHAYSGDNLYVSPSRGDRECVSCQRAKQRERTMRARALRAALGRDGA